MMRKFSSGNEILCLAPARFAANFVALQTMYKQKDAHRAMVVSKDWKTASCSKEAKGEKKFDDLVMDQSFQNNCAIVCHSDERPSMGHLFASFML